MSKILLLIEEFQEISNNLKKAQSRIVFLESEERRLKVEAFNKDKKIKEQENLILSLRASIKGLSKEIKELNKTPEIKDIKSMEIAFNEKIVNLQNNEKDLLVRIKRLQNKNNSLSSKSIKKEKVIVNLQKLIKDIMS